MKRQINIRSIVLIMIISVVMIGIGVGIWLMVGSDAQSGATQPVVSTQVPQVTENTGTQGTSATTPPETEPVPTEPEGTQAPSDPSQPSEPVTLPTEPSETPTVPTQSADCQHLYGQWEIAQAATCTENGIQVRYCEACGAEQMDTLSSKGHSYGPWKTTKDATCTDKGKKIRTCTDCAAEESAAISATGHDYDNGTAVGEAVSCVQTGKIRYTCRNCSKQYDVVKQGNHTFTYNKSGGYLDCELCGDRFYDEYSAEQDTFIPMDPNSALVNDRITLKEKTYTGKLSTWSEEWFEFRTVIYHCMMGHSESYHYGSGPSFPYEHPISKDCTKEEAEAVRARFILFLDDFEDVFGWRPDAPTVEYSAHYKGYCLFFDMKEMYSDYRFQIKKLSAQRKEEIEREVTAYLIHEWGVHDGMSVYEASCLISAAVWEWAYYDYSLRLHDAIDGFALGSCVCDGYAKMFLRFAEYCGIKTEMVTGKHFGQGHAWNKVIFSDGTIRYIDLTNSSELRRADNMENYKW